MKIKDGRELNQKLKAVMIMCAILGAVLFIYCVYLTVQYNRCSVFLEGPADVYEVGTFETFPNALNLAYFYGIFLTLMIPFLVRINRERLKGIAGCREVCWGIMLCSVAVAGWYAYKLYKYGEKNLYSGGAYIIRNGDNVSYGELITPMVVCMLVIFAIAAVLLVTAEIENRKQQS